MDRRRKGAWGGSERYTPEQIIRKLREAGVERVGGQKTHRWRKEYGGLPLDQAKRLKELEKEKAASRSGRQPKRGRLWLADVSCVRRRAEHRNHVWSYDFVFECTHDGRPPRLLTIVDEHSRECLARLGVQTLCIEPGSPWENGYVESFNGELRDELLDREIFYTLQENPLLIERWRQHHNRFRPHSALGYRPPAPEAIEIGPPEMISFPLAAAQPLTWGADYHGGEVGAPESPAALADLITERSVHNVATCDRETLVLSFAGQSEEGARCVSGTHRSSKPCGGRSASSSRRT